jgi:hypothetical protein
VTPRALELLDLLRDVVDVDLRDGVAGLTGELRLVEEERRAAAGRVDEAAGVFLGGFEAERVGVEAAGPLEICGRDVGRHLAVLEHV